MSQDVLQGGEVVHTSPAPIEIRISSTFRPTFDDMCTLEKFGAKVEPGAAAPWTWYEVRALFNRAIVGGVGHLEIDPAIFQAIGAALKQHFEERANPNG